MDASEVLGGVRDAITVRRVFGDPIERDGALIVPVAHVRGGGGGGDDGMSRDGKPSPAGGGGFDDGMSRDGKPSPAGGGGFGIDARPVGAYVIRDGSVRFEPAIDLTRIIVGGQLVAIVALLVLRTILRRRS
ncbi:MAG: GerW family sporulation protein [Nitriliruptorales bacterium]